MVFSVPGGLVATRFGRKPTILVGTVALAAAFGFDCFAQNEAMLIGLLVLGGTAWALIHVNLLPMLYDVGSSDRIGAFTGLYFPAINIAAVIGPQTVGSLIDLSGKNYRVLFVFAACCVALGGLFVARVKETQRNLKRYGTI